MEERFKERRFAGPPPSSLLGETLAEQSDEVPMG